MRYTNKPLEKTKINLFAHSGEAVVFWLALAGLLFLAIVSVYRGYHLQKIIDQYNGVAYEVNPLIINMQKVVAINDSLNHEQDLLKLELDGAKIEIDHLNRELGKIKEMDRIGAKSRRKKIYLPLE